jgi:hydrogenase/urease accessory protein HupE
MMPPVRARLPVYAMRRRDDKANRATRGRCARVAAFLALLVARAAGAHELGTIQVHAAFEAGGAYRVDVTVEPTHVPPPIGTLAPTVVTRYGPVEGLDPAVAQRFGHFLRALVDGSTIAFDDWPVTPRVSSVVPEPAPGEPPPAEAKPVLRLSGDIPAGAATMTWKTDLAVGTYPLALANAEQEPVYQWLEPGQRSEPFALAAAVVPAARTRIIWQYLVLGFTHIVPKGLDHILFVLGLFLLAVRLRPLLTQVTAFTVAHTITLALTMYGVVGLSSRVVEPLIALSIVYVAVENVLQPELRPSRVALVFAFGLLHGMGFAGVLSELGLPRRSFVEALVSFNVGVEAGQLTVIALAALAVGRFRDRPWYRRRVVVPASCAIAAVGAYWSVRRIFG